MTTSCLFKRVRPAGFIALFTACALVGPPATEARAGAYGVTVAALTPKQRLAAATYKKAKMRFVAGDYDGALTLFRQAEQLHPGAAPKHKIAECLDKLGRTEEAIAAYQLFIDSNPTGKYQQRVARARQRIEQLKATLGAKATLTVTPVGIAFAVSVDGVPSRGPEVALSAGQHTIEVSAPGYQPARQQVNAAKGQHL
ncbi:MAG TPA: tetratricopeptide repeat protein, partial [Sorangium sp.]|nr:tetratricopeptide repeat protein [Sorangium sp.]